MSERTRANKNGLWLLIAGTLTADSVNSRDRRLLAQLSKPAGTLPAPFHRSHGVAPFIRVSSHLSGASSL